MHIYSPLEVSLAIGGSGVMILLVRIMSFAGDGA